LIINLDSIAAVKFSTIGGWLEVKDIPIVNICLKIPEGSLDMKLNTAQKNFSLNADRKREFRREA
jgi:hypothetical protein